MSYGPVHAKDCNFFAGAEGICNCGALQEFEENIRRNAMQPYQERVVNELKELSEKREKLATFLAGPPSSTLYSLPSDEQTRLRRQLDIMVQYEGILQERIDHFPAK
jgi:hypothetical protein